MHLKIISVTKITAFTSFEMILAVGTSQGSEREMKSPKEDILSAPGFKRYKQKCEIFCSVTII